MKRRRPPTIITALDVIDTHIGRRLRYQRILTGLSQMKLGSQSGVSFQQIQKYERGINGISASSLLLFAHILKVPVTWFYEEMASNFWNNTHQPPASEANDDILYRRETLALIRAYYRLTKKCRRGFYDFLVSAADEGAEKL